MFSIDHLNALRAAELAKILTHFRPAGARVLEIGAGTGQQASLIAHAGFDVDAVEIPESNYAQDRLHPITDFDGRHIPFANGTFDIVFSSNVLEHVPDLVQMHNEIRRVLKPDGYAVHVLPTHAWRFWTTISAFPTAFQYASSLGRQLAPRVPWPNEIRRCYSVWGAAIRHLAAPFAQRRHGERGNILSETWLFHPNWWRQNFKENGFEIIKDEPMGLFYTGNMTLQTKLSLAQRARLARQLGSACHIFELKPTRQDYVDNTATMPRA